LLGRPPRFTGEAGGKCKSNRSGLRSGPKDTFLLSLACFAEPTYVFSSGFVGVAFNKATGFGVPFFPDDGFGVAPAPTVLRDVLVKRMNSGFDFQAKRRPPMDITSPSERRTSEVTGASLIVQLTALGSCGSAAVRNI
jgi:hypothetical protein